MSDLIRHLDPDSAEYARDYEAGWRTSKRAPEGALERADDRNVSHAWYDGYADYAIGRPKWSWREARRNGTEPE